MFFLSNNTFKSSINEINTRKEVQLNKPIANFVSYQSGVYCANISIFNALLVPIAKPEFNKLCIIEKFKNIST